MSTDSWWHWIVLVFILIAFLIRLFGISKEITAARMARPVPHEAPQTEEQFRGEKPAQSAFPQPQELLSVELDDLELIKGIGPEIAALLRVAGITIFTALAAVNPSRLISILNTANLHHLVDPHAWQEQAALAAEGRWEELIAYQATLKGGG